MAANQSAPLPNFSDTLKTAVNDYHLSIGHHGPYNVVSDKKLVLPMRVTCVWPNVDIVHMENKCVYICDTASLARLQIAMSKLLILDKGLAWPHVNLSGEPPTMEWFLYQDDIREVSSCPFSKRWFIISHDVENIFDYVVTLHNLVVTKSEVSFSYPLFDSEKKNNLTLLIMEPGDLSISVLRSSYLERNDAASVDHHCIHLLCVPDKHQVAGDWGSSFVQLTNADLEYHCVTSQIPQYLLQSIKARFSCQCLVSDGDSTLHSKVIIKDELVISDGFSISDDTEESSSKKIFPNCQFTKRRRQQEVVITSPGRCMLHDGNCVLKGSNCMHMLKTVLKCPICTVTFIYGFQGKGLGLLMGHIYDSHYRLLSHCTLVIKKNYEDLVKNAVKCGHSSFFEGL